MPPTFWKAFPNTTTEVTAARLNSIQPTFLCAAMYGADSTGAADSAAAINQAVTDCVAAGGGTVMLEAGTYKINSAIDLSGARATNRGLAFVGAGSGNIFSGGNLNLARSGSTYIKNFNVGPAVKAYGTLTLGTNDRPIVNLNIGGFAIQNQQNIGAAAYTVDLDYLTQFGIVSDIYCDGNLFTGNGFRLTNTTNGGTYQNVLMARGFTTGIGHYFAAEVTNADGSGRAVDSALNSGNSVHLSMHVSDCKIGCKVAGTTLFNSVTYLSMKCVNGSDITGSIGLWMTSQAVNHVDISTHIERFATGIVLDGSRGTSTICPITTYPAGTPWLTTGSITTGTNALTLTGDANSVVNFDNGDPITVQGAGAAGADLVTTVSGGGNTANLTLTANAGTTVVSAKVTGVSAGVLYRAGAMHTLVQNHRAQGHTHAARFDGGSGNDHSAWNAGGITTMFAGGQLVRNNVTNLVLDGSNTFAGRTGATATNKRAELMWKGENVVTETIPKLTAATATIQPATQAFVGYAVGLCAGETITGIACELMNAPTTITLVKLGLYDSAGTRLAVSATQHATWTAAAHKDVPFTASWYVRDDGIYYLCYLAVGTGTMPQLLGLTLSTSTTNASNGGKRPNVQVAAQTDMNTPVTFAAGQANSIWLAAY